MLAVVRQPEYPWCHSCSTEWLRLRSAATFPRNAIKPPGRPKELGLRSAGVKCPPFTD